MASDNFNRANETPLAAPWTQFPGGGSINLVSNAIQAAADGIKVFSYAGAVSSADQYSQAVQTTQSGNADWGPCVRVTDEHGSANWTWYWASAYDPGEQIGKFVIGSYSLVASVTADVANGDTVRIEAEGSTIRYKLNGAEVTGSPATDTSITAMGDGVGVYLYETGNVIDDWAGGDLAAPLAEKQSFYVSRRRTVSR